MNRIEEVMHACRLCPRMCGADRLHGKIGYCGEKAAIVAARAALHRWEEPCISGTGGSGTVFLSGCTLRCVFCQNREIAAGHSGREISLNLSGAAGERRAQYQSGHADTLFRLSRGSSEESQGERADDSGHIQYERL